MKINRNLPADDILQYEAERNARLLYNEVHLDAPMEPMAPYEDIVAEADIQLPMPERTTSTPASPCRSYLLHPCQRTRTTWNIPQAATYHSQVLAHLGEVEAGGGQPPQPPQPPTAPQRWMLPCYPAPPKAPTPPAPWQLAVGNVAPLRRVQTKDLERSRRLSWRF